jgi:hypothetical protein
VSSSSEVQIAFRQEVSPGVFDTGALQAVAVRSESLGAVNQIFRNDAITGNRAMQRGIITGRDKSGDLPFYTDLAPALHPLIDAFMFASPTAANTVTATDISFAASDKSVNSVAGDFTAVAGQHVYITGSGESTNNGLKKVLTATSSKLTFAETITDESAGVSVVVRETKIWRNGSTQKYLSIQRAWLDHSPVAYDQFLGMLLSQMTMNFQPGNTPFNFAPQFTGLGLKHVAGDAVPTQISTTSLGSVTAAPSAELTSPAVSVYAMLRGGIAANVKCSNFTLQVAQGIQNYEALQYLGPASLISGDFDVTGTFEIEFTDKDDLASVRANAVDEFGIAVLDSQNRMFLASVPDAELVSGEPQSGGRNQIIKLPMGFSGNQSTLGHALQVEYLELS